MNASRIPAESEASHRVIRGKWRLILSALLSEVSTPVRISPNGQIRLKTARRSSGVEITPGDSILVRYALGGEIEFACFPARTWSRKQIRGLLVAAAGITSFIDLFRKPSIHSKTSVSSPHSKPFPLADGKFPLLKWDGSDPYIHAPGHAKPGRFRDPRGQNNSGDLPERPQDMWIL